MKSKGVILASVAAFVLGGCSMFIGPPAARPATQPLYGDSFQGQPLWRQSSTPQRSFAYVKGGYEISTSKPATWWFAPCPFTTAKSFDGPYSVSVRARVHTNGHDGQGAFGVVFDYIDSKNFKWLAINHSGEFQLGSVTRGSARIIRDWTVDAAIRSGDSLNDVELYQYADGLDVYVNGALVATDASVPLPEQPFEIKLMAYNYDSTNVDGMTALFKSFTISRIE